MTSRTHGAARDRNRLDLIFQDPPCFTPADVADIISGCITPPPTDPIVVSESLPGDDASRTTTMELPRDEALARLLTAALSEFLVDRALESDADQTNVLARFRLISEAAQRLQRVLGMPGDHIAPHLSWPIERGFLHPMMRASRALITRTGRTGPRKYETARPYLTLLNQCRKDLGAALAGVNYVARLAASAARQEKFQAIRSRRSRDDVLDRFITTLGHIWTGVLVQELEVVTNSTRNSGRWAPIPDSLNQFIVFVGKCAKPLGVQFSREELMSRATRLLRRDAVEAARKPQTAAE